MSRYKHAARHLEDCAGLASRIGDFGAFPAHKDYVARLRREHGRKPSFWSLVNRTGAKQKVLNRNETMREALKSNSSSGGFFSQMRKELRWMVE